MQPVLIPGLCSMSDRFLPARIACQVKLRQHHTYSMQRLPLKSAPGWVQYHHHIR